jgi:hypothetical protein
VDPTYSRDRVVQLCPPAIPYIKKSFEGILMYELAGDYINKWCNYADPTCSHHKVITYCPFFYILVVFSAWSPRRYNVLSCTLNSSSSDPWSTRRILCVPVYSEF